MLALRVVLVAKLVISDICGKVKHKLRVTNYEFKFTSYEFKFTRYEFKSTS